MHWDRDAERVDVAVAYTEATATGEPTSGPRWLSGKIAFEKLRIPDWPIEELSIELAAERSIVSLAKLAGRIAGGTIDGVGHIDLGPVDRAPFALDLRVRDFETKPMCATFGLPAESIDGHGFARVHMVGALRPGGDFANEGQLSVNLVLKDGTVARLPTLVAIARLPSLAGVTGLLGRPLPYTKVEADVALANGRLAFSNTKLLGPQLRILGSGEMDLHEAVPQYDFVIALALPSNARPAARPAADRAQRDARRRPEPDRRLLPHEGLARRPRRDSAAAADRARPSSGSRRARSWRASGASAA